MVYCEWGSFLKVRCIHLLLSQTEMQIKQTERKSEATQHGLSLLSAWSHQKMAQWNSFEA